jgi:hypothetical protein
MEDAERFRNDTMKDSGRSGGHTWRSGENLERLGRLGEIEIY